MIARGLGDRRSDNHRTNRLAARLAIAATGLLLAGCASGGGPRLAEVVQLGYPGHVELQPKLSVGADVVQFPYTPGTLIFALATDSEGDTWTAQTDLRCGHAVPITRLRTRRVDSFILRTGVAVSARQRARAWLAANTGVSLQALSGVSSVRIALTDVRRVAPSKSDLDLLSRTSAQGCPLAAAAGWKSVAAVLIGDVKVDIRFERGFSLAARLALLEQLQLSFGVGYKRVSDSSILGRQVAFAVAWR
jgi:hypothetical protein